MIDIILTYRFSCDWPEGCHQRLTLHGSQTLTDAKARARREGWTISLAYRYPRQSGETFRSTATRCPGHSYRFSRKPTGRRPRVAREARS